MSFNFKTKKGLFVVILIMIGTFLGSHFFSGKKKVENASVEKESVLLNHPIYSKYAFENSEKIINIGIQPLYSPTGLISEAMKRDLILKKALVNLGLEIKFYPFLKGNDVNIFLENKDLDIGIGGDMPTISAAAKMDVIIPLTVQQGFVSIISNNNILASKLRGKRLAYPFGSIAHYVMLDMLVSEGLSELEVDLVPMAVPDLSNALERKEIDVFSAWEPISTMALKEHETFKVIYQQMAAGYMYFLKDFYKMHPEATLHIIASVKRAFNWMIKSKKNLRKASKWNKETGEALIGRKISLSIDELALLARKDILGLTSIPLISIDDLMEDNQLHREFNFLKSLRKIPNTTTWNRVRDSFNHKMVHDIFTNQEKYNLGKFDYGLGDIKDEEEKNES
jgi:sulfonate transport system substrate-binding protein